MSHFPAITGKELVKTLEKLGCRIVRTKGSHVRLESPRGKKTTVPVHTGHDVPQGLLRKILYKDLELSDHVIAQIFED